MHRQPLPVFPIDEALPALRQALHGHTRVLLEAPPGAGKSTIVPLALLDSPPKPNKRLKDAVKAFKGTVRA